MDRHHLLRSLNLSLGTFGTTVAAVIALIAGCATKQTAREQVVPGSGIAEFRQIADTSANAVQKALSSIDVLATQSNGCSSEALTAFSSDVQRLQVDSVRVRARSQAILTRGDVYFERWHETLSQVKDREVRALAETRRPLLQESFQKIKQSAEQCRTAFRPFLDGLRALRNSLENDAMSLRQPETQKLLEVTRNHGSELVEHLAAIRAELDSMKAMLTPPHVARRQREQP